MRHFTALFQELDCTTSSNAKVRSLVKYFIKADPEDALWMISLFIGKRPKRTVQVSKLREWTAEICDIPYWLFEESYHVIGDLAETIAILLPTATEKREYSLSQLILEVKNLKDEDEDEKKTAILDIWNSLERDQRFLFNKILTGGFRVGVSKKSIVKALSKHLQLEETVVSHRLMGNWTAETTTFEELLIKSDATEELSKPYPFYLAYALEKDLASLGAPDEWTAEHKWDGIRGQIIKRQGELFVWTRGEELVTDRYPEYQILKDIPLDNFVMDGEIIGWKDGKVLPFALLQKRLNRKTTGKKLLADVPIVFIAYDLFEIEGQDIRESLYQERRVLLEGLIRVTNHPNFLYSKEVKFRSWENLRSIRENARSIGSEGLMLKKKDSTYKVGRKKGDWWKWKVDPLHIDAVLLYAMRGHGRRSNLFSDFTFAVWSGDKLVPFAKAYSGLTDAEMKEITLFVNKNTIETFGPVRSVTPELVFEISFEGISRSTRHKSGVAVRFPRISRWRKDKPAEAANTLDDLMGLLDVYG